MKNIIKQVLGTDIAQKELVVCLGCMYDDWTPELYARHVFPNNLKGFNALLSWVKKNTDSSVAVSFVMEATGVYHESFAYFWMSITLLFPLYCLIKSATICEL